MLYNSAFIGWNNDLFSKKVNMKKLIKILLLYCFECEIETETKENKNGQLYCSQCRLKH